MAELLTAFMGVIFGLGLLFLLIPIYYLLIKYTAFIELKIDEYIARRRK